MAKVVDAEKLKNKLMNTIMSGYVDPVSFNFYGLDPEINNQLNNALRIVQLKIQEVNNRFSSYQYMLIQHIEDSSFEQSSCLLCRPGNEGLVPGFNPEDLPD